MWNVNVDCVICILSAQEDWVLCRVFHKKKADTEYAMDSEQEVIAGMARGGGTLTMSGRNYASSSSSH